MGIRRKQAYVRVVVLSVFGAAWTTGEDCALLRFCGTLLRLDAHFAIGNFIGDVIAGRTIQIRGDVTPLRSYLYAADLAVWLWTMLVEARSCRPYNVGSDKALSIAEVARAVVEALGANTKVQVAGRRKGIHCRSDTYQVWSSLESSLGWFRRFPLKMQFVALPLGTRYRFSEIIQLHS